MRRAPRFVAVVLAILSSVILGIASVLTSAVGLAATTALIVPGTGTPDADAVTNFKQNVQTYYLGDTTCTGPSCNLVGIPYPATLWPLVGGLSAPKWDKSVAAGVSHLNGALIDTLKANDDPVVIFGFSQGAAVVSNEVTNLLAINPSLKNRLEVVVAGNPDRPNGGIWTRLGPINHIPILDVDTGDPTPTDTGGVPNGFPITDVAFEYDPVGDAPAYPINLLADVNAFLGLIFIHTTYIAPNGKTSPTALPDGYTATELAAQLDPAQHPQNFQYYDNTTYVTIPTKVLPIMQPLKLIGEATGTARITTPIIDLLSPALRVIIDTAYDRTTNPGVYTPFRLIPRVNPIQFTVDLVNAVGQGMTDAIDDIKTGATTPKGASATAAPLPAATREATTAASVRANVVALPSRPAASGHKRPASATASTASESSGGSTSSSSSPSPGHRTSVGSSRRNAA